MKIVYTSFSTTSLNCKDRIQGVYYAINKILKQNNIKLYDFIKNPDIMFFELGDLGSLSITHKRVVKTLSMIKTNPKIILVADDYFNCKTNSYKRFIDNNNYFMSLKKENSLVKKEVSNFLQRILNKEFHIIYNTYQNYHIPYLDEMSCSQTLFDYSNVHDYTNLYKPKERKIVSYSFRKENNLNEDSIILSGLRENDCFKILCERRVCYMKDYSNKEVKYWVRNRHAQAYYANALVVGSKNNCFGKDYEISIEDYKKMDNKQFEEAVKKQKLAYKKNTDSYIAAENKILSLLTNNITK